VITDEIECVERGTPPKDPAHLDDGLMALTPPVLKDVDGTNWEPEISIQEIINLNWRLYRILDLWEVGGGKRHDWGWNAYCTEAPADVGIVGFLRPVAHQWWSLLGG
jgi:hypothetical protein